jgi:cobalt-zinc-cadmium efflux system membrane fusion protein
MKKAAIWILSGALLTALGCGNSKEDPAQEAPPPAQVVPGPDASLVTVDHPEQYPLATAAAHEAFSALAVTSVITPGTFPSSPWLPAESSRFTHGWETQSKRTRCC